MIYPSDFESKIGFDRIREQLKGRCATQGARALFDSMRFMTSAQKISTLHKQAMQLKGLLILDGGFPDSGYVDTASLLHKLEIEGTFLEPGELLTLKEAFETIHRLLNYFGKKSNEEAGELKRIFEGITDFPEEIIQIDRLIDRFGNVRDSASVELREIRRAISERQGQVAKRIQRILLEAQKAGIVSEEASVSVRDGRSVIPVSAVNKKKINGLIIDESATGRTFYIEPVEVVELTNELKELTFQERREIIRLLTEYTDNLRPRYDEIYHAGNALIFIDFIRAKSRFAIDNDCGSPILSNKPLISLRRARHILLEQTLHREGKEVVPLTVTLDHDKRILVISGPNAGGKSVCIKTIALSQYMFQCGIPIAAGENSELGIFRNLFMDMGDEQSIDNDLSTYSSHLLNMKTILRNSDDRSLIFIDEFGSGTEPAIGGAIAESLLEEFERKELFGVITTHYSNLKYYASCSSAVINGAMSFDVQKIKPLFSLEIGKPGSSFALEIARKIGLPENILSSAKEKIGSEQVNVERQLREIARDKNYWQSKRERIRVAEKRVLELEDEYSSGLESVRDERRRILNEAKQQAREIISEANRQIENTIREIREAQAERESTREARQRFEEFRKSIDQSENDERQQAIDRKIAKIKARAERKKERNEQKGDIEQIAQPEVLRTVTVGDKVRIKGQSAVGEVITLNGKRVTIAIGHITTTTTTERLELISNSDYKQTLRREFVNHPTRTTGYDMSEKRLNFKPRIDVRGMRAAEAIDTVREFVDTAIMLGVCDLQILHGKGTGALLQEIRAYLSTVREVASARDEHVDFGGSGITVVKLNL